MYRAFCRTDEILLPPSYQVILHFFCGLSTPDLLNAIQNMCNQAVNIALQGSAAHMEFTRRKQILLKSCIKGPAVQYAL